MHAFRTKDVERILGLPRGAAAALARRGFLTPRRGRRSEYEFSFQDLIILRAARSLAAARIPSRRIHRSLARLRRQLPAAVPLSGLSILAIGDEIIVREGAAQREALSDQYVLQFGVAADAGSIRVFEPGDAAEDDRAIVPVADAALGRDGALGFEEALRLEHDAAAAVTAYRRCLESDPACIEARINCGRLLHQLGALELAEQIYTGGGAPEDGTLLFNLGVLLEDLGRHDDAHAAYHAALAADPKLADAHYNLGVLSERRGRVCDALRHFNRYRKLVRPLRRGA